MAVMHVHHQELRLLSFCSFILSKRSPTLGSLWVSIMTPRALAIASAFQEKKKKKKEVGERRRRVRCLIFNFHIDLLFHFIGQNVLHGHCWLQV